MSVIVPTEALWPNAKSMDVETQYALSDCTTKMATEEWFLRPSVNKLNEIFAEYVIKLLLQFKIRKSLFCKILVRLFRFHVSII